MPFCGRPSQEVIADAIAALERFSRLRAFSRLYRSPAWPNPADPPFLNAVARIETSLAPAALLAALHAVEAGFGRRRSRRNGPRTLDLDLLDYDGLIRASDTNSPLILPHPRLSQRDFVLAPLNDLAPDWRHPASGLSARSMLARLKGRAAVPLEAAGPSGFAVQQVVLAAEER